MTYANVEEAERGVIYAMKEGKKTKQNEAHLSMRESFRVMDERFVAFKPFVKR